MYFGIVSCKSVSLDFLQSLLKQPEEDISDISGLTDEGKDLN